MSEEGAVCVFLAGKYCSAGWHRVAASSVPGRQGAPARAGMAVRSG